MNHQTLFDIAFKYHEALPQRIREYLNGRGIPDEIIDAHLLGWNGWRITIPIANKEGEITFFRLAKDPDDQSLSPKMLSSAGAKVELYGWEQVQQKPLQIIICEGEFDRLVLEAQGFAAVTSTAGAATFRPHWAKELLSIPQVYVCFDRDEAGRRGASIVGLMIPRAKLVELPEEVGKGGDVTDFFARLGRSREDFQKLLEQARPIQSLPQPVLTRRLVRAQRASSPWTARIERIKREVPIENVVGKYVKLRNSGQTQAALCPFHNDLIPSLTVYPSTGTFYCFGCRKHGDVITFLQEVERISFEQALDTLEQFPYNNGATPQ